MAAARGETPQHTPVWFMRQAGRSLPEYRELRSGTTMLEACTNPEMTCEITLQPVQRYDVDAAVFFSDIVVPLAAVGIDIDIVPGTGPVLNQPFRTEADLERLRNLDPCDIPYITEAIGLATKELGDKPLIGFAGAPYTLASYLIEGGPSRDYLNTKTMMRNNPDLWNRLLNKLAAICGEFLRVQVEAGASAIQLFDSWAGSLSKADFRTYALPYAAQAMMSVSESTPRTYFGVGTSHLLESMRDTGASVIGVDWRTTLDEAAERLPGTVLQGNLDPTVPFADTDIMLQEADKVLQAGQAAPGHIFNLGHGVHPTTNPDQLKRLVDHIHETTRR